MLHRNSGGGMKLFSKASLAWVFVAIFLIVQYLFVGEIMVVAAEQSPLVFELFAAVMGSIVTVAAMAVMMKAQAKQDTQKEYSSRIFEKKLEIYQELLHLLFSIDDDNRIDFDEIHRVENQIGIACLVANTRLVSLFSQYMYQLKVYGVLYFRSMTSSQLENFRDFADEERKKPFELSKLAYSKHVLTEPVENNEVSYFVSMDEFIQGIRDDLNIIEGNVMHDVEHFVRTPIDKHGLFTSPNIVK